MCERLMDPQALRVWLLPSRPLFGFFLMSLHLFGSLDCRLGWCSLCIIMLASWVAPSIAASSESIYRDPMKAVDAPPDSDVAWMRMSRVATTRQNCRQASPAAAECVKKSRRVCALRGIINEFLHNLFAICDPQNQKGGSVAGVSLDVLSISRCPLLLAVPLSSDKALGQVAWTWQQIHGGILYSWHP